MAFPRYRNCGHQAKAIARAYAATPAHPQNIAKEPQSLAVPTPDTRLREAARAVVEACADALAMGRVSTDGDGWFAEQAGWPYDEQEPVMNKASAALAALRAALEEADRG